MPLSRRSLERIINSGKISINPYNEDQLVDNGYELRCGSTISAYESNENAYLVSKNSISSQTINTYTIPDNGYYLEPRRIYEVTLKEAVSSEDYSLQIVPSKELARYGLTVNVSGNVDYNAPGEIKITLTSTQPVIIHQDQIIAIAYFTSAEGDGVPSGGIIMWQEPEIPVGWLLCDGTNGTPDLRDRFVLGYGNRNVGTVGGEERVTLTVDQIPSHNHSSGDLYVYGASGGGGGGESTSGGASFGTLPVNGSTGYTGGGESHNNMPPYYVLYFIQKE